MTREEQIKQVAEEWAKDSYCDKHNLIWLFKKGTEWADKHPNAIDMSYLQNWYQDSIDETKEPIWTDQHLEELFNDFYLIPKCK